jgi:hypothetical protein
MTGVGSAALAIVTEPQTWVVVTFAATGMVLYANALRLGQVGPVTAVLWIAEVIAPSIAAVALLGDDVRAGWALSAAAAALVMVFAAAVLATAPAGEATAEMAQSAGIDEPTRLALPADLIRPARTAGFHQPRHSADTLRPALPAAPQPAGAASGAQAERVIWWGSSPIWIPPARTLPVLAMPQPAPVLELTWSPPPRVQAAWPEPQRPDAGTAEIQAPVPRPSRRPWPEYYPPEPLPAASQPGPWSDLSPEPGQR